MAARPVIWIIDTSSICEVRRGFTNEQKPQVFNGLTNLVSAGRLIYPSLVLEELERAAKGKAPDAQYMWAKANSSTATSQAACSLEEAKAVLAIVPTVLDPQKDSGADEADPYILAVAVRLREDDIDARIVTEERTDTPTKMSLNTAAGILGIPSLPLSGLAIAEKLL